MRAIPASEARLITLRERTAHVRVYVSHGTWEVELSDLDGENWVESVEWREHADTQVATATVRLARERAGLSLAPLVGSKLQRNGLTAARLLEPERRIRIETQIAPVDSMPDPTGEWTEQFRGFIVEVSWGEGDSIVLDCEGQARRLMNTIIEEEHDLPSSPPVDAEELIQQIIDAGFRASPWAAGTEYVLGAVRRPTTRNGYCYLCTTAGTSHATTEPTWPTVIGATVTDGTVTWTCFSELPTLYTPESPRWLVNRIEGGVAKIPVMQAIRRVADQIGWDLRYRWDDATSAFRLTLREPARNYVGGTDGGDARFPASFFTVRSLKRSAATLRNRVRTIYSDAPPIWQSTASYAVGDVRQPTTPNGLKYEVTSGSGAPGASEPTWPTTVGGTVVDGNVEWTCIGTCANERRTYVAEDDLDRLVEYGPRFCELVEASSSNINTQVEASRFAGAVLADYKRPRATGEIEIPLYPYLQVGDVLSLWGRTEHAPDFPYWDGIREFSVLGLNHFVEDGEARTTVTISEVDPDDQTAAQTLERVVRMEARPGLAPFARFRSVDAIGLSRAYQTTPQTITVGNGEYLRAGVAHDPSGSMSLAGVIGQDSGTIYTAPEDGTYNITVAVAVDGVAQNDVINVAVVVAGNSHRQSFTQTSGSDPDLRCTVELSAYLSQGDEVYAWIGSPETNTGNYDTIAGARNTYMIVRRTS